MDDNHQSDWYSTETFLKWWIRNRETLTLTLVWLSELIGQESANCATMVECNIATK